MARQCGAAGVGKQGGHGGPKPGTWLMRGVCHAAKQTPAGTNDHSRAVAQERIATYVLHACVPETTRASLTPLICSPRLFMDG